MCYHYFSELHRFDLEPISIRDGNGRYIILKATVQCEMVYRINLYEPNRAGQTNVLRAFTNNESMWSI